MPTARRSARKARPTPTRASRTPQPPRPPPVAICRLRVPLPDSAWIARFSSEHAELPIEVLGRLDLGPATSLTELRLGSPSAGTLVAEVEQLDGVDRVEALEGGPDGLHLRVVHRTSPIVPIFRELHLMRRFPFRVQAGVGQWVVVASEPEVRRLLAQLERAAPGATLESVRHEAPGRPTGPLTERQSDLLQRAVAAGYFEVPRRLTLTELARDLGMAASTLSESLARVEQRILQRWPGAGELPSASPPSSEP